MDKKEQTSHRLTPACKQLLRLLAEQLGVSQTDVIEMAVRRMAAQENVRDTNTDISVPPTQD